nr:NADH dehydrogenase subunit 2 [Asterorhombus filifer]
MNPLILSAIIMALGLGTVVTFSSSHWLLAWMGLEINTLAILPLLAESCHPRAVEAGAKYFLTQATGAATLMFASVTNAWITGQWAISEMTHPLPTALAITALSLKIGLAPVHIWLPEVLQGVALSAGLVISTWQKLAPFVLISQLQGYNASEMLGFVGFMSIFVGGLGGLNQTQARKILAYSSVAHLGWTVLVLHYMPFLGFFTLIVYCTMTTSAFLTLNTTKATSINKLTLAWAKAPVLAALVPLVLLSLGGLPPLTGFGPKWFILNELLNQQLPGLALISSLSALPSLYFYLRLFYSMTITLPPSPFVCPNGWRFPMSPWTLILTIATTLSLMLLPTSPTLLTLFIF